MAYENLDTKLVNALLEDGRASLRGLSEGLGVSVTTVSNHLRDLENDGVIDGYTPRIDYDAFDYDVTAILQLKVEGSALSEITSHLKSQEQMVSVYETTGNYDAIAIGKFRDTDDMNAQIKTILTEANIHESNTSVVLNAVVDNQPFQLTLNE